MQHTITKPQTATDTRDFPSSPYRHLVLSADNLAGSEKVTVDFMSGATALAYLDDTGTAVTLTATVYNVTLPGGPIYRLVKDSTAGACGVYADTVPA